MVHIGCENSIVELVGFPQAIQHRNHHQFICAKTAKLSHRISKGQVELPDKLDYIRLMWLDHIHVHDRAFEDFLAS